MTNNQWPMPNATDEELVAKIIRHDREALGELFQRYQKPFFNLAYRFLGDYFLADDLVSEIFLRIYKYLKSYNVSQKFKPWAYKIATNVCLTFRSQKSRLPLRIGGFAGQAKIKNEDSEDKQNDLEIIPDPKVDLAVEAEKNEVSEKVQKALSKLPEKYRLALYLYYFEDLKYEEIAEDLSLPINTVRTHIKRGKKRLKEELRDLI